MRRGTRKNEISASTDHHVHKAVQHRDGKAPWCNICGLTRGYKVPKSLSKK